MKLFKRKEKKELTELEIELKKIPKRRRKRALELLEQYNKGMYLRPDEEVDNRKLILEKR